MKRSFNTKESSNEGHSKNKESDFFGWGEYFHAKKQKLDKQFKDEVAHSLTEERENRKIFENVVIHVNGYTNPSSDELRRLVYLHGGRYLQYYSKSTVTHIVATNLPNSKIKELRNEKVVRPEWITDSIKMGKLCFEAPYLLYSGRTFAQPTLASTCSDLTIHSTGVSSVETPESTSVVLDNKRKVQGMSERLNNEPETYITSVKAPDEVSVSTESPYKTNISEGSNTILTDQPFSERPRTDTPSYSGTAYDIPPEQLHDTSIEMKALSRRTSEQLDNSDKSLKLSLRRTASTESAPHSVSLEDEQCSYTLGEPSTSAVDNHTSSHANLQGHPKAGDPNFVSAFYSNSRLHYLSTWSAELKQFVNKLVNEKQDKEQMSINKKKNQKENVIMHIDMDCFFVSVTLSERPELRGKPVAVCHAGRTNGGKSRPTEGDLAFHGGSSDRFLNSMSEIASCSYEARAFGVRNGKFLGNARKLCPNLICVPYEFDKYRAVSQKLYEILVSYSHEIEAVSCDEAYIDVTHAIEANQTPMQLAQKIRQEIKDATGCPASVGISYNVLLARMCTREAKPNGQFYLPLNPSEAVQKFIGRQKVSDLPGVGWALRDKLQALNVHSCAELQQLSLQTLQQQFGTKTGKNLYNICRGVDDRPLKTEHSRKSVSAEINYGIRFTQSIEADKFIKELAEEVQKRLLGVQLKGRNITLKLKVRKKGAPMPAKFMGHGICDNIARSCTLPKATDDSSVISNHCIGLFHQLKVAVPDIRGMGIQVSKLTNEEDRLEATKVTTGSLLQFVKPVRSDESKCGTHRNEANTLLASASEELGANRDSLDFPPSTPRSMETSREEETRLSSVTFRSPKDGSDSLPPLPRFSPSFRSPDAGSGTHTINHDNADYLPSPSQVDPSVLDALPKDIRLSLERAYASRNQNLHLNKRSANESVPDVKTVLLRNTSKHAAQLEEDKNGGLSSPTEIDPSFLGALPENLRLEVEMDFERKRKKKISTDGQAIQSPIKFKNFSKVNSPSKHRSPTKKKSPAKNKSPEKSRFTSTITSAGRSEAKSCEINSSNKSELTEGATETQVSLAGAVTLSEVKQLLREWVASCDENGPCGDDVQVLITYLAELVTSYNLERMWTTLKFMNRISARYPGWKQAFRDIVANLQSIVYGLYGSWLPRLPAGLVQTDIA